MAYIAAADFREKTVKPYTAGLLLTENDGADAYIDLMIALATNRVELDLNDDFEPPNPDVDETIDVTGNGLGTLNLPRRVRSLTAVSVRDILGNLIVQIAASYRLVPSLNAAGTAMIEGRKLDALDALPGLTTLSWPLGLNSVQLVGKFGWAAVPTDIQRLVALRVYELVKAKADPTSTIVQRTTVDAVLTYGPSPEITDIETRYRRPAVLVDA